MFAPSRPLTPLAPSDTLDTMSTDTRWVKAELPADLHKWLRHQAIEKDQTLSETIVVVLLEAMQREKKK